LVAEKIRCSAWVAGGDAAAPRDTEATDRRSRRFPGQLDQTRTVAAVRTVEGHAAKHYFQRLAERIGAIGWSLERGGTTIPDPWRSWDGTRTSELSGKNRRAVHPVNSLLNFGYAAAAAQLTRALVVEGFDVYAGYLHADSDYRAGLAWDAMELVRHRVDAAIVDWLRGRTWRRSDFVVADDGGVFLGKAIRPAAVERMVLDEANVRDVLCWLRGAVEST
jgi:CRISPR-associated protein Cas1